ncbi:MAG: TerB family tellurite resistance protein, partial [Haliea sp.]|nr:TerB family tellurite resistance protein [Haliea sp.]
SESLALPRQAVHDLIATASARVEEATSLYEFTRVINDYYGPEEKLALIASMWKVAYADGDLDKYEEHLIRQVAELTYVPHQDYIRCKLEAKPH